MDWDLIMPVYWDLAELDHNTMPSLTPASEFQDVCSEYDAMSGTEEETQAAEPARVLGRPQDLQAG